MRLAAIVLLPVDHIHGSLRIWMGKRVVVAAIYVAEWAVVLLVKVVVIDMSRINWAIVVVGSCRLFPRIVVAQIRARMLVVWNFVVVVPMLVAFPSVVLLFYEWMAPLDLGSHLLAFGELLI